MRPGRRMGGSRRSQGVGFWTTCPQTSGGRPEGGIARAARELALPGKSIGARRKFIERAIAINTMWPEVKLVVRGGRLDGNQTALLAIAGERSLEAQLGKVKEIVARKAARRRKSRGGNCDES